MARRGRKRRRWSQSEVAELLRRFDGSGQSQTAFSRETGVALTTLQSWLRRRRQSHSAREKPAKVVPVRVTGQISPAGEHIEVKLSGGRLLCAPVGIDPVLLARYVRALETGC